MATYIALLRAVNIGSHKKVAMGDLRALVERLGFSDVSTLLQSGNVVFRGVKMAPRVIESSLEAEASRRLGLTTEFMVRTSDEWRDLVTANPLRDAAAAHPSRFLAIVLKGEPTRGQSQALEALVAAPEQARVRGRCIYLSTPNGVSKSKLTTALIVKTLGTAGTGRNWNTVLKLADLAKGGHR